ncbi:MAG: GNAT family N-acetyltransferase [Methylobacteriaceae bacterium]|nr:GNAT family N-acetyltransferase [Methylobacteriaceae bacterium]
MRERIVALRDRVDLVPTVAKWSHEEFWSYAGRTLEQTQILFTPAPRETWLPRTFVLLQGETPIGTASVVEHDLDIRPNLTPWLASLVVDRAARGHGHSRTLVKFIEDFARDNGVKTLWLFTWSAEGLYAKLGWRVVERLQRNNRRIVVMNKDLVASVHS